MAVKPIPPGDPKPGATGSDGTDGDAGTSGPDQGEELITGRGTQRDASGKFVKGGGGGTGEGAGASAGAGDPSKGNGAAPKGKWQAPRINTDGSVIIFGKQFKDLAHVEQVLKSKVGDAAKASSSMAQLQNQVAELSKNYRTAVEIATGWQKAAEPFLAQIQAGQAPQPGAVPGAAPPAAPGTETADEVPASSFSPSTYNQLLEKFGQAAADTYHSKAMAQDRDAARKWYEDKLNSQLQERLAPLEQQQRQIAEMTAAHGLISRAAAATKADGSAMYPELQDAAARENVLRSWAQLPPELRYSDDFRGIRLAVMDYRDSAAVDDTRAESDDLGLGDLESFTVDSDGGEGVPRPGEGGQDGEGTDLAEKLVHGDQGMPAGENADLLSLMPTP